MGELAGRTALISGAAIAQRFAAEGVRVVLTARTLDGKAFYQPA